jgi:microsomal prostaglandin-E synthase 2
VRSSPPAACRAAAEPPLSRRALPRRYHIEDERAAVVEGINKWVEEGVGAGPFAGGAKPNFADVCVFGCLKAIDRTAAWTEVMSATRVAPWYGRMREAVEPGNACTSRQ